MAPMQSVKQLYGVVKSCIWYFVGEWEGEMEETVRRERLDAYQIMIIRKDDRICGIPKMTLVKTGQNSDHEPAGSK